MARSAVLTVDLRDPHDAVLASADKTLADTAHGLAESEGCTLTNRRLARFDPVAFDADVVDLVAEVGEAHGHRVLRLASGAGHDAQMLARVCPTAMIFVPSVDGVSHNPAEHTRPEDLEAGANVLLEVLCRLAAA